MFERARDGAGDSRTPPHLAFALADVIGVFGAFAGAFGDGSTLRRRQLDPRAPGFRQTDGNRLPGRPGAMLTMTDFVNFLAYELARLRRRRLALAAILTGFLNGSFQRHLSAPRTFTRVHCANVTAG